LLLGSSKQLKDKFQIKEIKIRHSKMSSLSLDNNTITRIKSSLNLVSFQAQHKLLNPNKTINIKILSQWHRINLKERNSVLNVHFWMKLTLWCVRCVIHLSTFHKHQLLTSNKHQYLITNNRSHLLHSNSTNNLNRIITIIRIKHKDRFIHSKEIKVEIMPIEETDLNFPGQQKKKDWKANEKSSAVCAQTVWLG